MVGSGKPVYSSCNRCEGISNSDALASRRLAAASFNFPGFPQGAHHIETVYNYERSEEFKRRNMMCNYTISSPISVLISVTYCFIFCSSFRLQTMIILLFCTTI
jgi:hypothetical protein